MKTFAVIRSLPGITMEQLGDVQKAAIPFDKIIEVLDPTNFENITLKAY